MSLPKWLTSQNSLAEALPHGHKMSQLCNAASFRQFFRGRRDFQKVTNTRILTFCLHSNYNSYKHALFFSKHLLNYGQNNSGSYQLPLDQDACFRKPLGLVAKHHGPTTRPPLPRLVHRIDLDRQFTSVVQRDGDAVPRGPAWPSIARCQLAESSSTDQTTCTFPVSNLLSPNLPHSAPYSPRATRGT